MAIMDFVGDKLPYVAEKVSELRVKKEDRPSGFPAYYWEVVVNDEGQYRRLAEALSWKLCKTADVEGIEALTEFMTRLSRQAGIAGVVFLISGLKGRAIGVSLEVLAALEENPTRAAQIGDLVERAEDDFSQRLPGRISSSLEYIDISGDDLDDLKSELVAKWNSEDGTSLIVWTTYGPLPERSPQPEAGRQQIRMSR